MMAAAAVAAGAFFQISLVRNAAQLESFGNLLLDGMLKPMQFFLRVQKPPGGGIFQQFITVLFKIGDFHAVERLSVVLLFVKRVALAHHGFVLAAGGGIRHKSVNAPADGRHFRLFNDGLAKFPCFLFNFCRHMVSIFRLIKHICRWKAMGLTTS